MTDLTVQARLADLQTRLAQATPEPLEGQTIISLTPEDEPAGAPVDASSPTPPSPQQ